MKKMFLLNSVFYISNTAILQIYCIYYILINKIDFDENSFISEELYHNTLILKISGI
jgi:hypothetical protein